MPAPVPAEEKHERAGKGRTDLEVVAEREEGRAGEEQDRQGEDDGRGKDRPEEEQNRGHGPPAGAAGRGQGSIGHRRRVFPGIGYKSPALVRGDAGSAGGPVF